MQDGKSSARSSRSAIWILTVAFLFFAITQAVWLHVDQRMLAEDRHFAAAAGLAHEWRGTEVGRAYPYRVAASQYPPLIIYLVAPVLVLFGPTADVAVLALLPFAALLLFASWRLFSRLFSPLAAAVGAAWILTLHHFIDNELGYTPYPFIKEFMLDLPLSAIVALAGWLMLRLREGPTRGRSFVLAIVLAGGALTKITFPAYLLVLLIAFSAAGLWRRKDWRLLWKPALIGALLASPWYVLQSGELWKSVVSQELSADVVSEHGLPMVFSRGGVVYYLRSWWNIASPPLLAVVVVGWLAGARRHSRAIRFSLVGIALSYLLWTLVFGKTDRVVAPYLIFFAAGAAALIDAIPSTNRPKPILAILLLTMAAVRILWMNGLDILPFERGLSSVAAPVRHDWQVGNIMGDIQKARRAPGALHLAVLPFLRHFRHSSFMQHALEHSWRMNPDEEWMTREDDWQTALERSEFIVVKAGGYLGPPRATHHIEEARDWVSQHLGDTVHRLADYPLPDGATAILYRQDLELPAFSPLPGSTAEPPLADFSGVVALRNYQLEWRDDCLVVHCQWETQDKPDRDYRVFIQLRDGWCNIKGKSFVPGNGRMPLMDWPARSTFTDHYVVPLPDTPLPDDTGVWLGWMRLRRRLPIRATTLPHLLNAVELTIPDGDKG